MEYCRSEQQRAPEQGQQQDVGLGARAHRRCRQGLGQHFVNLTPGDSPKLVDVRLSWWLPMGRRDREGSEFNDLLDSTAMNGRHDELESLVTQHVRSTPHREDV